MNSIAVQVCHRDEETVLLDASLSGVRVLEFGHIAAGPFAGMLLADLGADVVKVEPPYGDLMRGWPPVVEGGDGSFSLNFASLNRNKRSVVADLKDPQQLAMVFELALQAEIIIENYRPGTLEKLGLGFQQLKDRERGLIYCSISGFGSRSPYRSLGAYDLVIQGMSGLMSVTGEADGPPVKCGVPVADFVVALYAAYTSAALLPKVRSTGEAVHVDCPMLDCLLAISALQTSEYYGTKKSPRRLGSAHPRNAPYQAFDASDGAFVMAAGNDRQFSAVCDVAGLPQLRNDPRFKDQASRAANADELAGHLQAAFEGKTMRAWLQALGEHDVPCGPVNTYEQILADEHVAATDLLETIHVPAAGPVPHVVFPARIGTQPSRPSSPPPRLGEHTDAVVTQWLRTDNGGPARTRDMPAKHPDIKELVEVHDEQGVRWLTLAGPRGNAVSRALTRRLHNCLSQVPDDIHALVLRSRDPHFCVGFDLTELAHETDESLLARFVELELLIARLRSVPVVTVACLSGAVVGAGADLALACDHRLGAAGLQVRFPGAALGVVLGRGQQAARLTAHGRAAALAGSVLDAPAALRAGLVTELVDGELEARAASLARSAAGVHPAGRRELLVQLRRGVEADGELAALVRSAVIPGLQERMSTYAAAVFDGQRPETREDR